MPTSTPTRSRRRGAPNDHDRGRVLAAAKAVHEADAAIVVAKAAREAAIAQRTEAIREAHRNGVDTVYIVDLLTEGGAPLHRTRVIAAYGGDPGVIFDLDEAIQRYQGGASLRDLAPDYRVSASTLKKALQDAGVELRDRGAAITAAVGPQPPSFDVDTAIERYHRGESIKALSIEYRCSPRMVRRELEAAGVELRDRETAKQLARKQATT